MPKESTCKFLLANSVKVLRVEYGLPLRLLSQPPSQVSLEDLSLASLRQSAKARHASIRERITCFPRKKNPRATQRRSR